MLSSQPTGRVFKSRPAIRKYQVRNMIAGLAAGPSITRSLRISGS
jgi:hypothetical protein